MKTFIEEVRPESQPAGETKSAFPTFEEAVSVKESKSCISESMNEKLTEMMEAMKNEMKTCHDDESTNTAESYMKECESKLNEVMESMKSHCNECMK
jgi:hypothetical protein